MGSSPPGRPRRSVAIVSEGNGEDRSAVIGGDEQRGHQHGQSALDRDVVPLHDASRTGCHQRSRHRLTRRWLTMRVRHDHQRRTTYSPVRATCRACNPVSEMTMTNERAEGSSRPSRRAANVGRPVPGSQAHLARPTATAGSSEIVWSRRWSGRPVIRSPRWPLRPGYGKTTLVAQWLNGRPSGRPRLGVPGQRRQRSRPVVDPRRSGFGACRLRASPSASRPRRRWRRRRRRYGRSCPAIVATLSRPLRTTSSSSSTTSTSSSAPACHEQVQFLISNLPAQAHLVIITRSDPGLRLGRLRASSDLAEIRAGRPQLHHARGQGAAGQRRRPGLADGPSRS